MTGATPKWSAALQWRAKGVATASGTLQRETDRLYEGWKDTLQYLTVDALPWTAHHLSTVGTANVATKPHVLYHHKPSNLEKESYQRRIERRVRLRVITYLFWDVTCWCLHHKSSEWNESSLRQLKISLALSRQMSHFKLYVSLKFKAWSLKSWIQNSCDLFSFRQERKSPAFLVDSTRELWEALLS